MLTHSRCLVVLLNNPFAVDGVGHVDRAGPPLNAPTAELTDRQTAVIAGNKMRLIFISLS
jgi:hypothetical protein